MTLRKKLGRTKRALVRRAGLAPAPPKSPAPAPPAPQSNPLEIQRAKLLAKRTMGPAAWEWVLNLAASTGGAEPVIASVRRNKGEPPRLVIRHDIDNDIDNAVRMAEREAAAGIRSTYLPLHTAWYYRWESGDRLSPLLLDALEKIAALGHEIAFHNNAITRALQTGEDPRRVLERELAALRDAGFAIVGTAAHGDVLCRTVGFVNSELFTEFPRPELGPPDRTLVHEHEGVTHSVALNPAPLADFGLEYEASFLAHDVYLSDVGGRWSRPPIIVEAEVLAGAPLTQILIHPEYWALDGEPVNPRPVRPASIARLKIEPPAPTPQGETLKIITRGDCCARRALEMNPDLLGAVEVVRDEKSRTDFFLEHPYVGSPSRADIERYLDVDRMSNSQRYYAYGQTDRDTLSVRDAGLIMMDNYADMNFQGWRHKRQGWKLWVHLGYLKDKVQFADDFTALGHMTFDQSLETHVALIEQYRLLNGHIPALYLNQPTHLYRKLDDRAEFRRLGLELEKAVPDLYFGDIADEEFEPDDLGSCGPGQTLHFSAASYKKMIGVALEKGLARWLPQTSPISPS